MAPIGRAISKLSRAVEPPAVDSVGLQEGAGMSAAGGEHFYRVRQVFDGLWSGLFVGAVVTQLLIFIRAPAMGGAVVQYGTTMSMTGGGSDGQRG